MRTCYPVTDTGAHSHSLRIDHVPTPIGDPVARITTTVLPDRSRAYIPWRMQMMYDVM